MKKYLLTIVLSLLGMTQVVAQEYEYVPFVREGVKWVYWTHSIEDDYVVDGQIIPYYKYHKLEIKGDTVINGMTYKAMHKYSGHAIDEENDTVPIYLREADRKVYGIVPDRKFYQDCRVSGFDVSNIVYDGTEFVLYDFDSPETFYMDWYHALDMESIGLSYDGISEITAGPYTCRRHTFSAYGLNAYLIEGIGFDGGWGYTLCYFDFSASINHVDHCLSHVIEDGEIIYKGINYDPNIRVGIDEVVEDKVSRPLDPRYYDLMGRAVGTEVPTTPGIYIHQGKKICVSQMP